MKPETRTESEAFAEQALTLPIGTEDRRLALMEAADQLKMLRAGKPVVNEVKAALRQEARLEAPPDVGARIEQTSTPVRNFLHEIEQAERSDLQRREETINTASLAA